MRLSFGQEMRMAQKQILAPRMIQSMEILQLPIMALQERIQQEMEENPVLGMQETDPDSPESQTEYEDPDTPSIEEKELIVDEKHKEDDFDRLVSLSQEWDDHFDGNSRPSSNRLSEDGDRKHDVIANISSPPETLQENLHDQLAWFDLDTNFARMVDMIIYNLDSNGYLPGQLEDILPPTATEEDLAIAQKALELVQTLDPPGVGARNLRECLLLQLRPEMPFYEELHTLISDHLEDIKDNRLPLIQRKTGYSIEHIQDTLTELRLLNPKPGAIFESNVVPTLTPDVYVEAADDGTYQVRVDDQDTPNLYINAYYRKMLEKGSAENGKASADKNAEETKDYIKKKINSAQWLIESIEQRRSTVLKVSQAIVDHQTDFLDKGPEFIEPLKMQQIADKVGVHVTTVSRAVDDKWIQTPRGLFPLKRFFVGGTVSANGEEVAWDAVRLKLQEVIDNEDKSNPFSDDELVKELAKHELKVARRTVTKYRKAMDIPSSRQRRDWTIEKGNGEKK